MNRLIMLCFALLLLTSCSLLRRKNSAVVAEQAERQEKSVAKGKQVVFIRDSTEDNFIVEIIPNGTFNYSLKDGFIGKGSSVKMKGKGSRVVDILAKTKLENTHQLAEQNTVKNRKTETVGRNVPTYLIWLIPIIIFGLWLRHKVRRR